MESDFYLAFSVSPGVGPKRFTSLLQFFKSAERAWSASQKELENLGIGPATYAKFDNFRASFDIQAYKHFIQKLSVTFISQNDSLYPKSLLKLSDPPIGLFIKGNTECLTSLNSSIAIVGSRKMTNYGASVTRLFAGQLAEQGITIISGMALGVDAVAHRAAVEVGGRTIAVLGNGVDLPYPSENRAIYASILEKGGMILSEYPPGTPPTKGSFPARNHIIAGLSNAVLVTEASKDSGSLITAEYARNLSKKVMAVPGPITSEASKGSLYLLKNEAVLVSSVEDIQKYVQPMYSKKSSQTNQKNMSFTSDQKKIIEQLQRESLPIDAICKKTQIPMHSLLSLLSELEMQGVIMANPSGNYSVVLK